MIIIKRRKEWKGDAIQHNATRVKTGQLTATDVTSAGFETGQLRNSLSNFDTWPKFNFGKPGNFETGPCNLAGSGFETGVAVRALICGALYGVITLCKDIIFQHVKM
jgi:hypothetical protein